MKPEDVPIFIVLSNPDLMGFCIDREAAGEPYEGKVGVGTVILERVDKHDWEGKTIKEVILKRWQFSWTMPEAGQTYYDKSVFMAKNLEAQKEIDKALKESCDIAAGLIDGSIPRDPDLAAAHCCMYVNGQYRQHLDAHPEIHGERWWQKMKLLKIIAKHEFYG